MTEETPTALPEPSPPPAAPAGSAQVGAPDAAPHRPVVRSYFNQRYAKLVFGSNNTPSGGGQQFSLVGYSVAGEETVIQIPEMGICFDVGRAPQFCLNSELLCLSHGHMDHVAGIAYYLSQRFFQGLKPGTVLLPMELAAPIDEVLKAFRKVERQQTPYRLVPMAAGELYELRKDLAVRTFSTHHGQGSLGYSVVSVREKLKPEFQGLPGPELGRLRKEGASITYRLEVPLVAFLGDTAAGKVFEHPDVVNARVLITECTFFDLDHRTKAKAGKHLHVEEFAQILPTLKNEYIVVNHVSRRTGVRRAKSVLKKLVGEDQMKRVTFLMDFDGAQNEGDASSLGPDTAE